MVQHSTIDHSGVTGVVSSGGQVTTLEIGHASDTTLSRASAGVLAVEGTALVKAGAATGSGITMATARLLGRTSASSGAIEEISVGAGLSLSAGALTASGSSLTSATADSSADVTLTADTIADATGASQSCVAGTWLLLAQLVFQASTAARDYTLAAITDSSNVVVSEVRGAVANTAPESSFLAAIVAPGSTTTYKVRGQSGRTGNKILRYSSGTQIGTRLIAIRLA